MEWKLSEIRDLVGGELHGDPDLSITGLRSLESARPEHLSFVRGRKFVEAGRTSQAGALIVPPGEEWRRPVITVPEPELAIVALLRVVSEELQGGASGIHPTAVVEEGAEIADDAVLEPHVVVQAGAQVGAASVIGAGSVVGRRTRIGRDCRIHGNVTLYYDVTLGDRVIIHGGSVIGADGFGYVPSERGPVKIPQIGTVRIEDDVEIGALVTIDRAMLDATIIRAHVKIDDHCHVAHNCDIGEGSMLAGGAQLAGSVKVGKGVIFAGASGITDGVEIGDGAKIGAASAVLGDVPAGAEVFGIPARENILRAVAAFPRLPDIHRNLNRVLRHLGLDPKTGQAKD